MSTERRRYFRIDDNALIKYRGLAPAELDAARAQMVAHHVQADNLRTALEPLDARLAEMMPALRRESRVLAEAIELINRKLGLLGAALATSHNVEGDEARDEHQPLTVNLSGGGMALSARQTLPAGSWLLIELVLLPANHALCALGRVTDVRRRAEDAVMGVEFEGLREADRDALTSHVLRTQAQRLREGRERK